MDVIIIGGGHNGLVAASYLARSGLKVTVLEQRSVVGGLCVTEEIFPGFHANLGSNTPHNLEPRITADMQLHRHGLQFQTVEPSSFMMFRDGRKLVGWQDRGQVRDEIAKFSRSDGDGYFETLNALGELGEVLDVSFFEPPPAFGEMVGRLNGPRQEAAFAKAVFGSASELVSERLESEEMRASLAMVAIPGTLMGPSTPGSAYGLLHRPLYRGSNSVRRQRLADKADTEATVAPFSKATPIGGMGAITQAMERSVRAVGVEIRTEARVASIKCERGVVSGVVLTSGEELDAPIVLSNVDPAKTILDLAPADAIPAEVREAVREAAGDGCMSKLNLALDGAPRFACAESDSENEMLLRAGFRVAPSMEGMDRAAEAARGGTWYDEPMTYGLIPSATDPQMAPDGKHVMCLSVAGAPYELKDGDWDTRRDEWAKHVIRSLTEYIPNLPDLVIDYRCLTPKDLEREFGLRGANITHGDITPARLLSWQPIPGGENYVTPIEGLYLCSVGNWPGNYVSGIPGMNCARKVLADRAAAPSSNGAGAERPPSVGEASPFESGVS
jgi:phytoene dehydrogenase-like protein